MSTALNPLHQQVRARRWRHPRLQRHVSSAERRSGVVAAAQHNARPQPARASARVASGRAAGRAMAQASARARLLLSPPPCGGLVPSVPSTELSGAGSGRVIVSSPSDSAPVLLKPTVPLLSSDSGCAAATAITPELSGIVMVFIPVGGAGSSIVVPFCAQHVRLNSVRSTGSCHKARLGRGRG